MQNYYYIYKKNNTDVAKNSKFTVLYIIQTMAMKSVSSPLLGI